LQGIELCFPETTVALDEGCCAFERVGVKTASMHAAVDFALEQASGLKDPKMLGNGRQRHVEGCGQGLNGGFALG